MPLAEAAVRGFFNIMQLLLGHGVDVHVQNKGGWTPLLEAMSHGHTDIVQLLFNHGANLEATSSTPLYLVAATLQACAKENIDI